MSRRVYVVTGTDTGVGKTVLTTALVRRLIGRDIDVAALKPFCSGGREDAEAIQQCLGNVLDLDEINPWHYQKALAPALAASSRKNQPSRRQVFDYLLRFANGYSVTLIEGAGGLLSPLTSDLDASTLIAIMGAIPIVVCPNRLGAINQTLLVVRALPTAAAKKARIVLMNPPRYEPSGKSNARHLRQVLTSSQVLEFPWLNDSKPSRPGEISNKRIESLLDAILDLPNPHRSSRQRAG